MLNVMTDEEYMQLALQEARTGCRDRRDTDRRRTCG